MDLIERQELIDRVDYLINRVSDCKVGTETFKDGLIDGYCRIRSIVKELPSAQRCMTATSNTMVSDTVKIPVMDGTTERLPSAQPDVHDRRAGKWIYLMGVGTFECSVCGRQMIRNIFNYCPWCGADMRGE